MSIQNNTAVDVYQNFVLPTALDLSLIHISEPTRH